MKLTQRSLDMIQKTREMLDTEAAQVYFQKYHHAVEAAEAKAKTTLKAVETSDDPILVTKFFQHLWSALPDNKSIRSYPFFTLCDLAEFYCEGDFYEGE